MGAGPCLRGPAFHALVLLLLLSTHGYCHLAPVEGWGLSVLSLHPVLRGTCPVFLMTAMMGESQDCTHSTEEEVEAQMAGDLSRVTLLLSKQARMECHQDSPALEGYILIWA